MTLGAAIVLAVALVLAVACLCVAAVIVTRTAMATLVQAVDDTRMQRLEKEIKRVEQVIDEQRNRINRMQAGKLT